MIAARLLTPYFGSTIYTWGAVISIFLLGSSVGYSVGGKMADHRSKDRWLRILLVTGLLWVSILSYISGYVLPLFSTLPEEFAVIAGAFTLFFLPNTAWGAVLPIIMKEGFVHNLSGRRIGYYHTVSALGSVGGTILTTFILLPNISLPIILSIFTGCLLLAIALLYRRSTQTMFLLIPLTAAIFIPLSYENNAFATEEKGRLTYKWASPYHDLYVVELPEYEGVKGNYRFLMFDSKSFQGGIDLDNPKSILLTYIQDMVALATQYQPNPASVFMIGHGVGTLATHYQENGVKTESAELDPKVLEISRDYFHYAGENVTIGDGRQVLKGKPSRSYNIIFVDAYQNDAIPFHLTTKEFFLSTHDKLTEDGILMLNVVGRSKGDLVMNSIVRTVQESYPYVKVFGRKEAGEQRQNLLVVAGKSPLPKETIPALQEVTIEAGEIITDQAATHPRLQ